MAISNISDLLQSYQKNTPDQANKAHQGIGQGQEKTVFGVKVGQVNQKIEQQASLVSHIFGDAKSTASDSLKLTYQAAITKLNEILAPQLGTDQAISQEALKKQGGMEYWTPENTAKRIVSTATSYLEGFKKVHPELEGQALMDKFQEVVGGGLQKGFDEAKAILTDLKVFDGQVKDNFESTTQLVSQGMTNFVNQYLGITDTQPPSETTTQQNSEPQAQKEQAPTA